MMEKIAKPNLPAKRKGHLTLLSLQTKRSLYLSTKHFESNPRGEIIVKGLFICK